MSRRKGDPISELRSEHRRIISQLNLAGRAVAARSDQRSRSAESLRRLEALVAKHFALEESSVYAPLKSSLGRDSPVDSMRREHASLLRSLQGIAAEADRGEREGSSEDGLGARLRSFQRAFGEHVEKEESVLFWLADLKL